MTVLADSPLAFWQMQEPSGTNAADSSGNGRDGTYTGGITLNQASLLAGDATLKSALFTAAGNGRVLTTYSPFAAATARSYDGWAKRADNAALYTLIAGDDSVTGKNPLLRIASGSNNILWFSDTDAASVTWTNAAPGAGTAFYWALTWSGASAIPELFINAVSQGALLSPIDMQTRQFEIGAFAGAGSPFNGNQSHVAIYNGVLTGGQISAHYSAGINPDTSGQNLAPVIYGRGAC